MLVAARGLTETQARRAFLRALHADPALGPKGADMVLEEKKRILSRDLGLELVETLEAADALGGLESFKSWMEERAQAFAPGARRFGLPAPRGVLLVGVQGCGKSLAAKVAASQLGVPLLRLDLPRVMGAAEGAEENLARALAAAEAVAPVAVWVDEIEKAFAGSGPGQGADSRAARLLGSFSTWLQERAGAVFAVATANDVSRLPPELLRRGRFDELFFVDLPDAAARRSILALHLRKRSREPERYDLAPAGRLLRELLRRRAGAGGGGGDAPGLRAGARPRDGRPAPRRPGPGAPLQDLRGGDQGAARVVARPGPRRRARGGRGRPLPARRAPDGATPGAAGAEQHPQHVLVHPAVREQAVPGGRGRLPGEVGEPAAGLLGEDRSGAMSQTCTPASTQASARPVSTMAAAGQVAVAAGLGRRPAASSTARSRSGAKTPRNSPKEREASAQSAIPETCSRSGSPPSRAIQAPRPRAAQ